MELIFFNKEADSIFLSSAGVTHHCQRCPLPYNKRMDRSIPHGARKQAGSIVRTSGKVDTTNQKQLKGHFSQIKGIFHQEDITIPNTYSLNSNGHLNILLLSMNRSSRKKSIEKTLELGKS